MAIDIFAQVVDALSQVGFYSFLLPWLFVFAIVYGLLMKADIFGKANNKVSGVLAIVIAFFASFYAGPGIESFFTTVFAGFGMVAAGILIIVLMAVLVGFEAKIKGKKAGYTASILLVIIGVVIFLIATGGQWFYRSIVDQTVLAVIFMIVVVVLAVAFIGGGEGESKPAAAETK